MSRSLDLSNAIVAVTGGATGIGFAISKVFAEAGCRVAIGSRRADVVESAIESLNSSGRVWGARLDVTDREQVNGFFDAVSQHWGEPDILVQAAGVNIKTRSMSEMTPEQWDQVMAINATGAYNCLYRVLPPMRSKRAGLIINISSVAGKRALALGGVAYSASKFAMTALGTCVSNEVGAEGVRITNVYPGEVDTPILENRPTPVTDSHRQSMLQPSDIAEVVLSIAKLSSNTHIPEIVVKPLQQLFY